MKHLIAFLLLLTFAGQANGQTPHGVSSKYFFMTNTNGLQPGNWFGFSPWISGGSGLDSSGFGPLAGTPAGWVSNGVAIQIPTAGVLRNLLCEHVRDTIAGTDTIQLFYSLDTTKTWVRSAFVLINSAGSFESDATHTLVMPAGAFISFRFSPGSKGGAYGWNSAVFLSLEFDAS